MFKLFTCYFDLMRETRFIISTALGVLMVCHSLMGQVEKPNVEQRPLRWGLVIHGGAGGGPKGSLTLPQEGMYLQKLKEALDTGATILAKGGSSLDAVTAVVVFMEDCPLFNAGKGAVLNEQGYAELDASIMDGATLAAGAVGGVRSIRNPILAARAVMERTNHVFLAGAGADAFAKRIGLTLVDSCYFIVPSRLEYWKRSKKKEVEPIKHGTVGAVALDVNGNLAAATSTGGMSNKMVGRLGDTPVIGAGTYADNGSCAVSCTGHGEFFIRNLVAYDLSALMKYQGMTVSEAANFIIGDKLKAQNADGGLISIDNEGNIAMPFNTHAMFRGYQNSEGVQMTAIYAE